MEVEDDHVLCRREWQAQQPVRTASLSRVVKMTAGAPESSFWVQSPPGSPSCSVMLTRTSTGAMWLLEADKAAAQPVRLALKTKEAIHAYLDRWGWLHIAEAQLAASMLPIVWHMIDCSTGKTAFWEDKLFWDTTLDFRTVVHSPAAQRVLGMEGEHTIIIMEADSLQDICCLKLAYRHGEHTGTPAMPTHVEWSSQGSMLAVQLHSPAESPIADMLSGTSEVHIYDTTSGQCLQSVQLQGKWAYVLWSSSQEVAAVCSQLERCDDETDGLDGDDESAGNVATTIRLMDPARQSVATVPHALAFQEGPGWMDCVWTPCGQLLVAGYEVEDQCPDQHSGVYILDPRTLRPIVKAKISMCEISWAASTPSGKLAKRVVAYLPYSPSRRSRLTFQVVDGEWEVKEEKVLRNLGGRHIGCLTPDGSSLVALRRDASPAAKSSRLHHHDLETGRAHLIAQDFCQDKPLLMALRFPSPSPWIPRPLNLAWTLFPSSWAWMYAFVHLDGSDSNHASVNLVDMQTHKVSGSWTLADLGHQANGRSLRRGSPIHKIQAVVWGPSGRHIALICATFLWVLSF